MSLSAYMKFSVISSLGLDLAACHSQSSSLTPFSCACLVVTEQPLNVSRFTKQSHQHVIITEATTY